jgi:hypothetical protein
VCRSTRSSSSSTDRRLAPPGPSVNPTGTLEAVDRTQAPSVRAGWLVLGPGGWSRWCSRRLSLSNSACISRGSTTRSTVMRFRPSGHLRAQARRHSPPARRQLHGAQPPLFAARAARLANGMFVVALPARVPPELMPAFAARTRAGPTRARSSSRFPAFFAACWRASVSWTFTPRPASTAGGCIPSRRRLSSVSAAPRPAPLTCGVEPA